MEATNLEHGKSVSATAQRFLYLRNHHEDPATTICSYFPSTSPTPKTVTSTNIVSLLCLQAANLVFQRLGFYPHEIGSYSLLSGLSMTLHQAHVPNSTIKIIGWWRSDAFLVYL